ncbi:SCP2 sterol-binding domain-containing protein [Geothrix sp. PMB-07]|uniref:SCP2 sterol-binding domain-containing protein n=1 Tax=Geothrix sp. PMB-07 TaxID=3068640 RepID=UPI0027413092|nr:SCP2 sterol-binding domain-containing protein [Geothrix sp. PMB-07]WLT30164.1 SCP2 sterol-binding domain-containing protein [Geothrix sp. PMB-07]
MLDPTFRGDFMALTVDGIFALMPELFLPEKAQGLTVSVYYQVTGEGGGDYTCLIENGAFTLKREAKPDATSVVVISGEDWIALNEGKLDPMQAFMTGKLKGTGDLGLLQKFPKFFKKPQKQGGPVKPLKDLVPARLGLVGAGLEVSVGGESWGDGAEVLGDEAAVRGLVCGLADPGPALLGGQLQFKGDMGLLRKAWKTWSAEPEITFPDTPGGKALATLRRRYRGGASGTLEVKVEGVPYRLDFSPEGLSVRPGEVEGGAALGISDADFAALNAGKLNLVAALLGGAITVKGDMSQVAAYTAHFDADVNPAQGLLESMPERFNAEKAGDLEAVVGYQIDDMGYTVLIRNGTCMVFPRLLKPCDTLLKAKADDFVAMSTGTLNAQEAFMTGKIQIEGDPLLMQKVAKSFRRPEV